MQKRTRSTPLGRGAVGLILVAFVVHAILACGAHTDDETASDVSAATTCGALTVTGVTASGNDGNLPANVLDNNLGTRWSNLGKGSWIQADLGATKTVCSIAIAWYEGDTRANAFTVGLSNDGATFTSAFSGTSNGTSTALQTYTFTPANGRYVRVTVNGNTLNDWASITELRVAGGDPASGGGETLFGTQAPPSGSAVDGDTAAVELGVKFKASVAGSASAVRFYRGAANAAGYMVRLWTLDGKELARATASDGAVPGWQEARFANPVALSAGTLYVASYYTSNGRYAGVNGGLTNAVTSGYVKRALRG